MRPALARLAAAQHGAFSTRQALQSYTRSELRARVAARLWLPVFRGSYRMRDAEPTARLRTAAAELSMGRPVPACLHTAAELLGFDVLDDPVTHVQVAPGPACPRRTGLWPHQFVLDPRDIVRLRCGLLCTSPDRTAIDLARHIPALDVLAVLDAALDTGLCTPESLQTELVRHARNDGVVQARSLIPLASTGTGSPQESRMRFRCHEARLLTPTVQLQVGPNFLDLGWEEAMVGLEYDGEVHDGARQRRADRRRHNSFEDRDWAMYYATDVDIYGPTDLFLRVRAAVERRSRASGRQLISTSSPQPVITVAEASPAYPPATPAPSAAGEGQVSNL